MKASTLMLIGTGLVLGACASSGKLAVTNSDEVIAKVTNEQFKSRPLVPYMSSKDNFASLKDVDNDVLSKESVGRFPQSKLEEVSDLEDPIAQVPGHCHRKEFKEGFAVLDANYDQFKNHPSYWNQVGTCYYLQDNPRKALLYYNKALELEPKYGPALNNIGVLYMKEKKDQKAMVAFKKAQESNPFSVTPMFNLAQVNLKYGLVDQAFESFKVLLERNPKDPDVVAGLATCYLFKNDPTNAVKLFSSLDSAHLQRADIGLNYVVALKTKGDTSMAKKVFKAIDENSVKELANYHTKVARYLEANK